MKISQQRNTSKIVKGIGSGLSVAGGLVTATGIGAPLGIALSGLGGIASGVGSGIGNSAEQRQATLNGQNYQGGDNGSGQIIDNAVNMAQGFAGLNGGAPEVPVQTDVLANGGMLNNNNITQYQGNSHAQGGIQLPGNEVENGETRGIGYTKDYVFSDRLKLGDKTFAEVSKNIESKYKNLENDRLAMTSKDKELGNLMQEQELKKQQLFQSRLKSLAKSNPEQFAQMMQAQQQQGQGLGQGNPKGMGLGMGPKNGQGQPQGLGLGPQDGRGMGMQQDKLQLALGGPLKKDMFASAIKNGIGFNSTEYNAQMNTAIQERNAALQNLNNFQNQSDAYSEQLKLDREAKLYNLMLSDTTNTKNNLELGGPINPPFDPNFKIDISGTGLYGNNQGSPVVSNLVGNVQTPNFIQDNQPQVIQNPTVNTVQPQQQNVNNIFNPIGAGLTIGGKQPAPIFNNPITDTQQSTTQSGLVTPNGSYYKTPDVNIYGDNENINYGSWNTPNNIGQTFTPERNKNYLINNVGLSEEEAAQFTSDPRLTQGYFEYMRQMDPDKSYFNKRKELHPNIKYDEVFGDKLRHGQNHEWYYDVDSIRKYMQTITPNQPIDVPKKGGPIPNTIPDPILGGNPGDGGIVSQEGVTEGNNKKDLSPLWSALPNVFQGLGNAALGMGLKYPRATTHIMDSDYVDPTRPVQEIREQYANVKDKARQVATGGGNYLSNLQGMTAGESKGLASLYSQYAQANAGIHNQAAQFNAGAMNQGSQFNAGIGLQEKQDKIGLYQNALEGIATGGNNALNTYYQEMRNNDMMRMAGGENFSMINNPNGRGYVKQFSGGGWTYYETENGKKVYTQGNDKVRQADKQKSYDLQMKQYESQLASLEQSKNQDATTKKAIKDLEKQIKDLQKNQ